MYRACNGYGITALGLTCPPIGTFLPAVSSRQSIGLETRPLVRRLECSVVATAKRGVSRSITATAARRVGSDGH